MKTSKKTHRKNSIHNTKYQGVFYREINNGTDKSFFVRYRPDVNARIKDKAVGRQSQGMTPDKANKIRLSLLNDFNNTKDTTTFTQEKQSLPEEKAQQKETATLEDIFQEYYRIHKSNTVNVKNFHDTRRLYQNRLRKAFGHLKVPDDFNPYVIDVFVHKLYKKEGLADATVKHHLVHLEKLIKFGLKYKIIDRPLNFQIEKPSVHNEKTEDLTEAQIDRLKEVLTHTQKKDISTIFWIALYTGFRAGSIFSLEIDDLDFRRKLIRLKSQRKNKKNNRQFPMPDTLKEILLDYLENHRDNVPNSETSRYLFPNTQIKGTHRKSAAKQGRRIKELAGLPEDFRPLHGLRHVYATTLASSGKVSMQTLQRLLDHNDYKMTSRYSHLRDETLRNAVDVLEDFI